MMVMQVSHQQGCGPDRLVVTEGTWVGIDDLGDPGIDAVVPRPGATQTWGVGQPLSQVEPVAAVEPIHPVIDRPAADEECPGDLLGRLALIES